MANQRNMAQGDKMRLFFAPDRLRAGGTLTLNANFMSAACKSGPTPPGPAH